MTDNDVQVAATEIAQRMQAEIDGIKAARDALVAEVERLKIAYTLATNRAQHYEAENDQLRAALMEIFAMTERNDILEAVQVARRAVERKP
jgi:hypothetical protein